jgi:hypothetical protein
LKNASPSFHLPPNKRSSRRHKTSKDKLDTEIFEMCMEYVLHFSFFLLLSTLLRFVVLIIFCYNSMCRDVWTCIDPEKMSDYAYFDSLWFNIYTNENDKSNVLRWIKAKKIFTRCYVFVPIVGW